MSDDTTSHVCEHTAQSDSVVAIFTTHMAAEVAVKKLQGAGFDMTKISILCRDGQAGEHVVGYYNTGDRIGYWGKMGVLWGGFWGLLFGVAFLVVPVIDPLAVGGPIVGWIIGALEGAAVAGGVSAVGGALYSIGIPKDSILQYEEYLESNRFTAIVHGATCEVDHAREILQNGNAIST